MSSYGSMRSHFTIKIMMNSKDSIESISHHPVPSIVRVMPSQSGRSFQLAMRCHETPLYDLFVSDQTCSALSSHFAPALSPLLKLQPARQANPPLIYSYNPSAHFHTFHKHQSKLTLHHHTKNMGSSAYHAPLGPHHCNCSAHFPTAKTAAPTPKL